MPLVIESSYRAPFLFGNPHIQTVFPTLFRKVRGVTYTRERIETPDGDFVDIDMSCVGSQRAAIVLHGLEGDSNRWYMLGMVSALNRSGWDAFAMNFRGCSGETNRTIRFYHSGETGDLDTVIGRINSMSKYSVLALVGFSLGGNVILKYLGERGKRVPNLLKAAVAFSVPCDLATGAVKIGSGINRPYMKRFLGMLHEKVRAKMDLFPGLIDDEGYERLRDFRDFDSRYTAPIFGFKSAEDYWEKASSKPLLPDISVPTLLVNAADDPFLSPDCYPYEEARNNPHLFFEVPPHGGHVGFMAFNRNGQYWSESRAAGFLNDSIL